MTEDRKKMAKALDIAFQYGQIDEAHHKAWVIDQMVRHLLGDCYSENIQIQKNGEDGPDTYEWNVGIAP